MKHIESIARPSSLDRLRTILTADLPERTAFLASDRRMRRRLPDNEVADFIHSKTNGPYRYIPERAVTRRVGPHILYTTFTPEIFIFGPKKFLPIAVDIAQQALEIFADDIVHPSPIGTRSPIAMLMLTPQEIERRFRSFGQSPYPHNPSLLGASCVAINTHYLNSPNDISIAQRAGIHELLHALHQKTEGSVYCYDGTRLHPLTDEFPLIHEALAALPMTYWRGVEQTHITRAVLQNPDVHFSGTFWPGYQRTCKELGCSQGFFDNPVTAAFHRLVREIRGIKFYRNQIRQTLIQRYPNLVPYRSV